MLQPPRIFTPLTEAPEAPTQLLPTAPAAVTIAVEPPAPAPATPTTQAASDRGLLARVQARTAARPSTHHHASPLKPSEVLAISASTLPRADARADARHRTHNAAHRGTPARARNRTLHKLLVTTIVMATIGTLASGTLATFNAQTGNQSNSFATGSLVLGNQPTGYVQLSSTVLSGTSLASIPVYRLGAPIPAGVTVTISDNATPTAHTQTLTVASNVTPGATTIPISSAPLAAQNYQQTTATVAYPVYYAAVTTTTALTNGQTGITALAVNATQNQIPSGTSLTLSNGVASQVLTLSASAQSGATSLTVTSFTATAAYPIGSQVFWSASALGVATTASMSGTVTSIPVNPLTAAIPGNAVILLNNPSISAPTFQSLTVTAAGAGLGATAIPVTSIALNNTYPAGSLISYNYSAGTTCYSTAVTSGSFNNGDSNSGCGSLVFTNYGRPQATAELAYTADVTISNQGSLPASKLTVYMQNCATTNNPGEAYNGTGDLCTKLEMFVQEWTNATRTVPSTCWYGTAAGNTCTNPITDPSPTLSAFNGSASPLTLTGGLSAKGSAGDTRYFTIGLRLPTAADNTYQGRIANFDFVWAEQQ